MGGLILELRRLEFEGRIFVSFGIAALALCLSSLTPDAPRLGEVLGLSEAEAFLAAAAVLVPASLLRMWAGTELTSRRMMAFSVQSDALASRGPYRLVRNPIYLADLLAISGFALVLSPIGSILPVGFLLHYDQLIRHEERALRDRFGSRYGEFTATAPRLLPDLRSLRRLPAALREIRINRDGLRHNALYVLFVPGLLVAAATGELTPGLLIGLPAVIDWAAVHTKLRSRHE